jgi:menaquinol-cytochrome c reductase iron-sulfur subunit
MSPADRRAALTRFVRAGLALMTTTVAGLVGLVASPPPADRARRWRRAASMFDLPAQAPLVTVVAERHDDGWFATRKHSVVFIDREGDGYRALSATCTHLGCRVDYDAARQQYICPCHGGVYARDGRVVSGPPPRPLERVAVRVNTQTADFEVEV